MNALGTDSKNLTPMMRQYADIKNEFPDALLFFRLGDFYEMFGEDAIIASKELGLVLTKRIDVPMCGVPWHASEMYLTKLVKAGHRVAICEQLETPEEAKKKRGSSAMVERQVTRIVTKGTLIEQSMLSEKSNNFLMSIAAESKTDLAIAYADVSTGRFFLEQIKLKDLQSSIIKIAPSEIVCPDVLLNRREILDCLGPYKASIRPLASAKFMNSSATDRLAKFFGLKFIDVFGKLSKALIEAASIVCEYITDVYKNESLTLAFPKLVNNCDFMNLDGFTRKSLELQKTQSGDKQGSLLSVIDKTETSQGGRMLARWLMEPLTSMDKINKRLDFVDFFYKNVEPMHLIRETLSSFPDIERSLSRILLGKSGPRDIRAIAIALQKTLSLQEFVKAYDQLQSLSLDFENLRSLLKTLLMAIVDEPPMFARDGGFIRDGYDQELDTYRNIQKNSKDIISQLQSKYIISTGIPNLKIKNNSVIGYFIEVTPNMVGKVPYKFTHRQSLANAIRYTSEELVDTANSIYSSESNAKRRELQIFDNLVNLISREKDNLRKISESISFFDVTTSFAKLAIDNNYVRPILTNEKIIKIEGGRHPVVEYSLKKSGSKFIENDCEISEDSIISILTGPNMGGKSTYLRQNAIIIIMAQIGSFVPASSAEIGVVDRIFSRVGASDDISSGRSTFMVEMIETATILQNATERSFVILDEIGRGTSTYDGLSIAWAVTEDLANNLKVRTIFATHYHELIDLKSTVKSLRFLNVKAEEWNDQIVFLHKIEEGFADKSYGLNVAALAGFPEHVIHRAKDVLNNITS